MRACFYRRTTLGMIRIEEKDERIVRVDFEQEFPEDEECEVAETACLYKTGCGFCKQPGKFCSDQSLSGSSLIRTIMRRTNPPSGTSISSSWLCAGNSPPSSSSSISQL